MSSSTSDTEGWAHRASETNRRAQLIPALRECEELKSRRTCSPSRGRASARWRPPLLSFGVVGRGHLEAAPRPLASIATLANRHPRQLGDQGLGQATNLGMARRHGGQRAAVAADRGFFTPYTRSRDPKIGPYFDLSDSF